MKLKIWFVILIKKDFDFSGQLKWEFLKYEIDKFTIHYTKGLGKERKQKISNLESELKKTRN